MQPHRGVMILVLAILGFAVCPVLGPVAWYMGNQDLAEIRAGRMDREGEQLAAQAVEREEVTQLTVCPQLPGGPVRIVHVP